MALMFYSSRHGDDDRVSDLSDNDKHQDPGRRPKPTRLGTPDPIAG